MTPCVIPPLQQRRSRRTGNLPDWKSTPATEQKICLHLVNNEVFKVRSAARAFWGESGASEERGAAWRETQYERLQLLRAISGPTISGRNL